MFSGYIEQGEILGERMWIEMSHFLENLIITILPTIISFCELIGIFVVTVSAVVAFWAYLKGLVTHKRTNFKFELAQGLATGLEFKMAAEILKTVLIHNLDELIILGAVILLRALMSLVIHLEMKQQHKHGEAVPQEK